MESKIASAIVLTTSPVAIFFTDDKPKKALQFKKDRWGCVIHMLKAASRGKTAVFDRETTPCVGGVAGVCFGNAYPSFPGGIEYFLSTGKGEGFPEGERYKKTPELAKAFVDSLPYRDLPTKYVVFSPLDKVDAGMGEPRLVSFFVNAHQLSALVVLANYGRPTSDNVIIPFGAGCHTSCLMPYVESEKDQPRAVVGNTDISVRGMLDDKTLSFTAPFSLYQEMEENVEESFLGLEVWKKILEG